MMSSHPFEMLRELAGRGATGELICVSDSAEVHVFLQSGRIAWATDSEHPFAFTRRLQKSTQIDAESFRDILESCQRERRRLGETLVSWGAATPEEVRAALLHQLQLAVGVLQRGGAAQALFLDRTRQFAQYDAALTFDLDEIVAAGGPSKTMRAATAIDPKPATAMVPAQCARRLMASVEGLLWAEVLDQTSVVAAVPAPATESRFPKSVVEKSTLDGADLVALRSPDGTLGGVALSASTSLWCHLAADAPIGATVSALAAFARSPARAPDDVAPTAGDAPLWMLGHGEGGPIPELREFFGRAPELLGALLTGVEGESCCGVGRPVLHAELAVDLARRRSALLELPRTAGDRVKAQEDEKGVGFRFRSVMTVERRVLCFGAELAIEPRRMLWLLLDRHASQGLGWAYLTSLGRRLLHVRCSEPT